jgi:hypothetical protein
MMLFTAGGGGVDSLQRIKGGYVATDEIPLGTVSKDDDSDTSSNTTITQCSASHRLEAISVIKNMITDCDDIDSNTPEDSDCSAESTKSTCAVSARSVLPDRDRCQLGVGSRLIYHLAAVNSVHKLACRD